MKHLIFNLTWVLLFLACSRDEIHTLKPDPPDLNTNGKQFMKQLKENPDWESIWKELNKKGTLSTNSVLINGS